MNLTEKEGTLESHKVADGSTNVAIYNILDWTNLCFLCWNRLLLRLGEPLRLAHMLPDFVAHGFIAFGARI